MTICFMVGEPSKKVMDLNLLFMKEISNMEKNMARESINMDPTISIMEFGHLIKKMEKEFINILMDCTMVNGKVIKNKVKEL